ncbi:hypothetical protein ACFWR6_07220 [Streptomyces griseus]|uniref:hypothetical protein n=1 Tax=Streptomyces griseus TaxID=1911 RepID=UPI003658208E
MSTLILIAMVVAALLLPLSILAQRRALAEPTASSEQIHVLGECSMCAPLRHPCHRSTRAVLAATLPGPRCPSVNGGYESGGC